MDYSKTSKIFHKFPVSYESHSEHAGQPILWKKKYSRTNCSVLHIFACRLFHCLWNLAGKWFCLLTYLHGFGSRWYFSSVLLKPKADPAREIWSLLERYRKKKRWTWKDMLAFNAQNCLDTLSGDSGSWKLTYLEGIRLEKSVILSEGASTRFGEEGCSCEKLLLQTGPTLPDGWCKSIERGCLRGVCQIDSANV